MIPRHHQFENTDKMPTHVYDLLLLILGIVDAGSYKGQLYCLQENGRLHRYFLLSIERCIAKLFGQSLWEQCAQV